MWVAFWLSGAIMPGGFPAPLFSFLECVDLRNELERFCGFIYSCTCLPPCASCVDTCNVTPEILNCNTPHIDCGPNHALWAWYHLENFPVAAMVTTTSNLNLNLSRAPSLARTVSFERAAPPTCSTSRCPARKMRFALSSPATPQMTNI
jgi:hypothetical protein